MRFVLHHPARKIRGRRIPAFVLLPWIICWLIVFPLIHVHPEADHAHGRTPHHHGGLVHSVLSQDLPCEFGKDPYHSSRKEMFLVGPPGHSASHAHALGHTEITLSAVKPPSDDPVKKQFIDLIEPCRQNPSFAFGVAWGKIRFREGNCSSLHLLDSYFSRPPPVFLL